MEIKNEVIKIFIIGAGSAGLACAHKLLEQGKALQKNFDITIFEASDCYGGRICTLKNFADFDIEIGAEEIHGNKSFYYDSTIKVGGKIFGFWSENTIYANYKGELCDMKHNDFPEIKRIQKIFDDVCYEHENDFEDITLREFMLKNNFSEDIFHIGNALLGVEAGTDLDKLSIGGFSKMCKIWEAGDDNYSLTNITHLEVLERTFPEAIKKVKLNCPIKEIDYTEENKVILKDNNGNLYQGNKCVLTVPITQLHNNKILFKPSLSEERVKALNMIKMDSCAKLVLKFKKRFWPENTCWLLFKGNVNMYWPTSQGKEVTPKDICLSALVTGKGCDNLRALYKESKEKFIDIIIKELEEGIKTSNLKDELIDYFWCDWTDNPYVEGGYSYNSVGENDSREIAKKPINNKIFFGGETFARIWHIGSIHGAVESGIDAAEELLTSIKS